MNKILAAGILALVFSIPFIWYLKVNYKRRQSDPFKRNIHNQLLFLTIGSVVLGIVFILVGLFE